MATGPKPEVLTFLASGLLMIDAVKEEVDNIVLPNAFYYDGQPRFAFCNH